MSTEMAELHRANILAMAAVRLCQAAGLIYGRFSPIDRAACRMMTAEGRRADALLEAEFAKREAAA